jgi:hypothetical protein
MLQTKEREGRFMIASTKQRHGLSSGEMEN